ncbi:hypothetical protein NDU88_002952 [Pleurodeles waltl]|uniref:Uncharacterized protein n=1 Tax=Pleurodeles waltl TaxID=8319 RepID=A0AAV7RH72_PLEWA|nr:hypothetical protein NDU88_002952 [Pleurodeles waltl]
MDRLWSHGHTPHSLDHDHAIYDLIPMPHSHVFHESLPGYCDGSDRFEPHTRATGAAAVGNDPEVTPRSRLPIGSSLHSRDSRNLKGEVPEIEKRWRIEEEMVQEASGEEPQKSVRTQWQVGTVGASGIPKVGARAERKTSTVPTWDEDRRPREATP